MAQHRVFNWNTDGFQRRLKTDGCWLNVTFEPKPFTNSTRNPVWHLQKVLPKIHRRSTFAKFSYRILRDDLRIVGHRSGPVLAAVLELELYVLSPNHHCSLTVDLNRRQKLALVQALSE